MGLARGARIRCFGEARRGPKGLEIVHPEYRRDRSARRRRRPKITSRRFIPCTEGVTQGRLRLLVGMALDQTDAGDIEDWLPAAVLADSRLPSPARSTAVRASSAGGRAGGFIAERAPSGAAPAGVRGTAGASVVAQVAAAAHSERSGLAACRERRAEGGPAGGAAVSHDQGAAARAARDRSAILD